MKNTRNISDSEILRHKAEELLKKKSSRTATQLSEVEMIKLIHELDVHQVELEMLNDELMLANELSLFDLKKKNDESLEQQALFTSALDSIADIILHNEDPEDILENANRILGETLQLDRSVIYQVSSEKNQITGLCEWLQTTSPEITPTIGNYPFDWFRSPLSELKKNQNYLVSQFNAINEHFIEDGSGIKLHKGMNIKSLLWYPFDFDEHRFYVFTLNQVLKQRQWTHEDISFVSSVAKQVSIALLKIRLLNEHKLLKESEEKLKGLSDQLESILDHIPGLVFYKDKKNNFIRVNQSFADTIHKNKHELANVNLADIYPASIAEQYYKDDLSVISSGIAKLNIEENWETEKGLKWVNTSRIPFIDANGEIIGVIGISMDITERKKAEIKIQQSEVLYRSILSASPSAITITDLEGHITFTSEKTYNLYGYDKSYDFIGHSILQYIDEHDHETIALAIADMLKGFFPGSHDYKGLKPDGSLFDISVNGEFIRDADGKPEKMIFISYDVTERKRLEEEKRKADSRILTLSMAIEQSPVTTVITDLAGNIEFVNPKFTETTGYTAEEAIGKNPRILKSGDKPDSKNKELWDTILSGQNWHGVFQNKKKNGELYWESAVISPVKDNEGAINHFLAVKEDITQRKQAEGEIKLKNEQLIQANAEKDKFFSIIAHDLRGPFNGFLGLSKLLAEDLHNLTQEEIQKMAGSMRDSATHLFRLLENLLEWARLQRGITSFEPGSFLLMSMIAESMHPVMDLADKKGVEIRYEIPADLEVFADLYMLSSTIRNLASNAVKFTIKGGKVTIVAKSVPDHSVEISVSDTGIGMNPEMVHDLFRLDVQTNRRGTEDEPSSGLGLLLCKDFVEKHGGRLWVESEEGKGSKFCFTIPADLKAKEVNANVDVKEDKASKLQSLKILIAEDDIPSIMFLTRVLKKISRDILHAKNGFEAIDASRNNPDLDLILMDIRMLGMTGYDATRQIRGFNKEVIIIAQTAEGFTGDREKAIEAGCNDYLNKPIDQDELMGLIHKYFSK
ncbi:MAG: PAS domain S-box protein [Bacteroidota bacterium]